MIEDLLNIFPECLKLCIPKSCQEVKVVFIPKSRKGSCEDLKPYWLISLTPFLRKTMEQIVDGILKDQDPYNPSRFKQYAYLKGRSVEIAFYDGV